MRARNFCRGGVFHQIENRHATVARQPRADVLDTDLDIVAHARFGDRRCGAEVEQVVSAVAHIVAFDVYLVGGGHVCVEHRLGDGYQSGVRHPGTVAAVAHFAQLVGFDFFHRGIVGHRIVLDGNLRGHTAHRGDVASMAGFHQQQRVGAQEGCSHGHLRAIRQAKIFIDAKFLDGRKNIIPAADVKTGAMLAQLEQNLVHLERGDNSFDQHRGFYGTLRHADLVLRHNENVVP